MPVFRTANRGKGGASHQEEAEVDEDSYSAGGVPVRTGLGRVDMVDVTIDSGEHVAYGVVGGAPKNEFTLELHNLDDGTEVADATDISGFSVTYQAHQQ